MRQPTPEPGRAADASYRLGPQAIDLRGTRLAYVWAFDGPSRRSCATDSAPEQFEDDPDWFGAVVTLARAGRVGRPARTAGEACLGGYPGAALVGASAVRAGMVTSRAAFTYERGWHVSVLLHPWSSAARGLGGWTGDPVISTSSGDGSTCVAVIIRSVADETEGPVRILELTGA